MMITRGLGLIPDWQFSSDPAVNPKINPHVVYPDGVTQTTVQPIGQFWNPAPVNLQPQLSGLGNVFDSWAWNNRKLLVLGGVGLLGVGLLTALGVILK